VHYKRLLAVFFRGDGVSTGAILPVVVIVAPLVLEFNSLQRRWIGSSRLDRVQAGEWRIVGMLGKDSLRARLVKE
jgi:hypothetical protein